MESEQPESESAPPSRRQRGPFVGTGVALVTPFTPDFKIDFDALKRVISHASAHADYLVVMGSTGEAATLSPAEQQQVASFVAANNRHKLPLVLGFGGNDTHYLLDKLGKFDFTGYEALLMVTPFYNKPTQAGLQYHFLELADTSPIPIILYNVPGRTGCNMLPETVIKLGQHRNILGVKEASGSLEQAIAIAQGMPDDFLLIAGDDLLTVPMISIGACGAISVIANAANHTFCDMVNAALDGDYVVAREALADWAPLNDLMYKEGNPTGIKTLLNLLGLCDATVRLPLSQGSDALVDALSQALANTSLKPVHLV